MMHPRTAKTFPARQCLQEHLRGCVAFFVDKNGWGIVLLLVSLMLTRGVEAVRGDMDESNNPLSAMHGYCTQELVNLILLGWYTPEPCCLVGLKMTCKNCSCMRWCDTDALHIGCLHSPFNMYALQVKPPLTCLTGPGTWTALSCVAYSLAAESASSACSR